jgi:hypothetical protein
MTTSTQGDELVEVVKAAIVSYEPSGPYPRMRVGIGAAQLDWIARAVIPIIRKAVLEEAAKVAAAHKPDRKRPLSFYDPEDREIIRAEENGEAIAASMIAQAIRSLGDEG